jgi:uncharacterized membrane protein YjgN (DUF898 family)
MSALESLTHTREPASVRCTGASAAFRRLVEYGALFELVTFGFYRFWLTTDIRRFLWSNTEIDGDAVEYTGRAKELLLGFLIALAVLGPVFLGYFLIGLEFERYKAFASVPLYGFFFMFGQFAVYRARRYRLTRTIWRGVRFWMTGSGWAYAWRSLLWGLLLLPTLGFAYPWRSAALERYKLGHTFYGTLPGRFDATGWQLFKRVWWVWFLGLLPMIAVVGGSIVAFVVQRRGAAGQSPIMVAVVLAITIGILMIIALPFLHAVRKAMEWRWWAAGIRFGDVAVACDLPASGLIGVYWALIGMGLLLLLGFVVIAAGIRALLLLFAGHGQSFGALLTSMPVLGIVAYAIWYLAMILSFTVLARIYTLHHVWRHVAGACRLVNPEAAVDVGSAGEAASAFGEGLADGLDFAGF